MQPRYPVYVPSRDRFQKDRRLTIKSLMRDEVPFRVVVVPSQAEDYARVVGEDRILVLPDDEHVLLDTRNWVRNHAEAEGHARHWQLDDNIIEFRRLWKGRRIPCHAGAALRVCEDLSDRFENVAVSGLNYQMFVPAETPVPFYRNVHVYSCTLVNHAAPFRWRLIYNDDTDLCLQALVGGWTTLLVNAFMANKMRTGVIRGGNTDQLYQGEEVASQFDTSGRFEMAEVLRRAWPGIVSVRRRFQRYQHVINWRQFETPLRLRDCVKLDTLPPADEYGLRLRAVKDVKSARLRELLEEARMNEQEPIDGLDGVGAESRNGDDLNAPIEWRGLPAFAPTAPRDLQLVLSFETEEQRAEAIAKLDVVIAKKTKGTWSAWYPPREREDLAALRFDLGDV